MNWQTPKLIAETLCLLVVAGSAAFFAWDTHQTQVAARGAILAADDVLDAVKQPCGGGKPCGTIPTLNKAITKIGDEVVTTQLAERTAVPHVLAAMDTLNASAAKLGSTADSLSGTASAATQSAQALTAMLGQGTTTLRQAQPVLEGLTRDENNFNALLTNPAIPETLANAERITWNANEITFDAKRVADDATKRYFTPQPWYRKALPYATTGAKIAAYALPW